MTPRQHPLLSSSIPSAFQPFSLSALFLTLLLGTSTRAVGTGNSTPDEAPIFETTTVLRSATDDRPNYRIPSILRLPNNDLLVIAEARINGPGDVGDFDIVTSRSSDRGKTWSPPQTILNDGNSTSTDLVPLLATLPGTGNSTPAHRIFIFFLRNKKQYAFIHSDDNARTWSPVTNIHSQVTKPEWDRVGLKPSQPANTSTDARITDSSGKKVSQRKAWDENWLQRYGIGPAAAAIQLRHGPHKNRIIVPGRHLEVLNGKRVSYNHLFYSDDYGATWKLGATRIGPYANELQLAELPDGTLYLNARNANPADKPDRSNRLVGTSTDSGATWTPLRRDDSLPSTQVHAALKLYENPSNPNDPHNGLLLFSNPNYPHFYETHPYGRYNMTLRWNRHPATRPWLPENSKLIYPHNSSYSSLCILDDGTIGLLYERGEPTQTKYWTHLQFARFNFAWLKLPPTETPTPFPLQQPSTTATPPTARQSNLNQ